MGSGNRQPLGISALCGRLLTAIPVSPLVVVVRTLVSRIPPVHLYLSQQIGVRSSKTSQCGSANRPSVVPQGSPRIWCLSKSLLVSQIAVSVCRHDLPPCTTKNGSLFYEFPKGGWRPVLGLFTFPTDWDIAHRVQHDLCMHSKSRKNQLPYS